MVLAGGTTDAEKKRLRFQQAYAWVLWLAAIASGATRVLQGSLAPDFIESGAKGQSAHIKSHHNVGIKLPGLGQIHPLRDLFKYEVRALAETLGLPDSVVKRQPFPGPGLWIRVLHGLVTSERHGIVRWADAEVRAILEKCGVYQALSQMVVALDCTLTVGQKGDGRKYGYAVIVRGVKTIDFMTAEGVYLAKEVAMEIVTALTKHSEVVRVYFDPTPKSPATMEFE